jgi:hypothetical protein
VLATVQLEHLVLRPRNDAPPVRKHGNAADLQRKTDHHKSTVVAATHVRRVPFQRRHAFTGRHVPHLERVVARPRHDAPPVRGDGDAKDLRRSQIITKGQRRRATHGVRVPFQRRHALAGRHVPHLERLVPRPRNEAPPVRKHRNAQNLRRRHIITKVQWTPQRTLFECPFSVATHSPVATSQTLSVLSTDADTTRRPSGNTATPRTYNERQIITKVQWTPQRTSDECPSSVATHLPVVTSHTLSVLSSDADTTRRPSGDMATHLTYNEDMTTAQKLDAACRTGFECPLSVATHSPLAMSHTLTTPGERYPSQDTTRRPSGNTATQLTYNEETSSQKYSGRRNAPNPSALPASPRTCRSPRPTP